jgi:hypothetical protein
MKTDLPNYYEKNLSLLQKAHPHVYAIMTENPPDPIGEVIISPSGKLNVKAINSEGMVVHFHDPNNPEAELPQFLQPISENFTGAVTLVGMGLGYTPLALLTQRSNIRHLAVFEPNPGVFRQAMTYVDLSPILQDPRLILNVEREPVIEEVIAPLSRVIQLESIQMFNHLPSFSFEKEVYENLRDKIFEHANRLSVGGATVFTFGNDFLTNRLKHLTSLHHNHLLQSLQNEFTGIPAIIVAGGPSLDKNIHLLPKAKGKAVIIAADTVLPSLLAHNIFPEFITAIDPQEITFEKFADVVPQTKDISLICMPWVAPKVPKIFPAERVFWAFSGKPIEIWINSFFGGNVLTGGAGTVAHLNLLSAVIMGCSPIIFMGQDLSFPSSSSHAKHTVLTDKNEMERMFKSKKDLMWIEGVSGEKVPTNRAFFGDKQYFERIITENQRHYINATEGGAHIEGTEILPLDRTLKTYCAVSHDIDGIVSSAICDRKKLDTTKLLSELKGARKIIRSLQKLVKKADKLTRSVEKEIGKMKQRGISCASFTALPASLQEKVKQIDDSHNRLDRSKTIWQMVEEITREGLKQSERMQHDISQLEKNPGNYLNWLLKNLERHLYINTVRTDVLFVFEKELTRILDHHEKEKKLSSAIETSANNSDHLLKLCRLYFQSEDLILARPILETVLEINPESAEANFLLGQIAAHHTDMEKANHLFVKAGKLDPKYRAKAESIYQHFGDFYLENSQKYKVNDLGTCKRLMLKGLWYCPDHKKIREELRELFQNDYTKIIQAVNSNVDSEADSNSENDSHNDSMELLHTWYVDLIKHDALSSCLEPEKAAGIYELYGNQLMKEEKFLEAVESYQNALRIVPENPEVHILITDALFALEKYEKGIHHLNTAAGLDRTYAIHWETIGDFFSHAGEIDDAISAYEQCFISIPENIGVLKKMGDCYRISGQLEAAHAAYANLKVKAEEMASSRS